MMVQLKPAPAARSHRLRSRRIACGRRSRTSRECASSSTVPPAIRIGGRMSKSSYDFTLQGPDTDELYKQAQRLEREAARLPGLQDVTTDLQLKNPRVNIAIDRDKAAALQLNVAQIESALYSRFRAALVLHHLLAHQPEPRAAGVAAGVPGPPGVRVQALLQVLRRPPGAVRLVRQADHRRRAADRQPLRPASFGDALVQPQTGRRAGGRGLPDPGRRGESPAGHRHHQLPRDRQSVSGLAAQPRPPAHGRGDGGLHRARRAV